MTPLDAEYVDIGYVEDGYVESLKPIIFKSTAARCNLRGPTKRKGTVKPRQPEETATGGQRLVFAPMVVEHTLTLEYDRLFPEEVEELEAFVAAVNGQADLFTFRDDTPSREFTCRFDSSEQEVKEEYFRKHSSTIALWSLATFVPLEDGVAAPGLDDAELVFSRLVYGATRKQARSQSRELDSSGNVYVYSKSPLVRWTHTLKMERKTFAELAGLIAFYCQTVQGALTSFTWSDPATAVALPATTNLITTPSFEGGLGAWNNGGNHALLLIDSDSVFGTKCLEISATGSGSGPAGNLVVNYSPVLTPGQTYTVSFYAKWISGCFELYADLWPAAADRMFSLNGQWKRYSFTSVADVNGHLYMWLLGAGVCRIDAVQVEAGAVPTPFVDGSRLESVAMTEHTFRFAAGGLSWEQSDLRTDRFDISVTVEEEVAL